MLRQDVKDKILLRQRNLELNERQEKYKWHKFSDIGVPSAIDETTVDIPADEQFNRVKNIDFTRGALKAVVDLGLTKFFTDMNDLSDYATFAKSINSEEAIPLYGAGRWTSDVEFGRQILNGVNPMVIKKCTQIPAKFPITEDLIKPYLTRGLTLEEEIQVNIL